MTTVRCILKTLFFWPSLPWFIMLFLTMRRSIHADVRTPRHKGIHNSRNSNTVWCDSDLGLQCHSCSGKQDCQTIISQYPDRSGRCAVNIGDGKCFIRKDPNDGSFCLLFKRLVENCIVCRIDAWMSFRRIKNFAYFCVWFFWLQNFSLIIRRSKNQRIKINKFETKRWEFSNYSH